MNAINEFEQEVKNNIKMQGKDRDLRGLSNIWIREISPYKYTYNFKWLGRPIIQFPQDMIAMQEIIWEVKPDLIIETGIAHGGSLMFYASLLELIGKGTVLGIDIDIRQHNREEIEKHPMYRRVSMIEGQSTSDDVIEKVNGIVNKNSIVMVCLDSNHTHDHVLQELNIYSNFVTKESYLVVFDTLIEDMPHDFFTNRPWGKGNNPKSAVTEFLNSNDEFIINREIEDKLLISVAPSGYLKRIK